MSEITCSICLEQLKSPVATPCGHVHCNDCLTQVIESGEDGMKSSCPTCRAEFPVVTPDLAFIPKKYHVFIQPPIRKIYLDIPAETVDLHEKIARLEARVLSLETDKAKLMDKCEAQIAKANHFAEGERKARMEAEVKGNQLKAVSHYYEEVRIKYNGLKQKLAAAQTAVHTQGVKRKSSQPLDSSTSSSESTPLRGHSYEITASFGSRDGEAEDKDISPPGQNRRISGLPSRQKPQAHPTLPSYRDLDPPPVFRKRPRLNEPGPSRVKPEEIEFYPVPSLRGEGLSRHAVAPFGRQDIFAGRSRDSSWYGNSIWDDFLESSRPRFPGDAV
ncbi:hypothetical protein JAAARDRAFT_76568 [Jaapia argillacea MUCL 33604]|uniref:RING-type domain-containing protein n=1 Tax=Jaapia argillacea MUCL 33604 TaxID=933084 RepID=A0A067QFV9_9AGAM|nr:hypothetical protein JAAARDRAFT_76568 [Jaapia argillacea MUCL 33604]